MESFVSANPLATFNGECAVILFFLLSGCVLISSIKRDLDRYPAPAAALAFAVRRVFRILPALLVCVVAIVAAIWCLARALHGPVQPYSAADVFNNLRLYRITVHGASWTLRVEMLAIPYLLIAGALFRRFGTSGLLAFLAFAILAYDNSWLVFGFLDLGQNLIYFALGCLIPTSIGRQSAKTEIRLNWPASLMLFLYLRHFFPYTSLSAVLVQAIFGFIFLSQVYHAPSPRLA